MSRGSPEPPADVTDAELAVLEELWQHGAQTTRALADRLYPGGEPAHYGTVQKLLQRLEGKRCVAREPGATPLRFRARVSRDDLVDLRLRAVVDKLCAGSWKPLLSHLAGRRDLDAHEQRALRAFLEQLDARTRRRRRR